MKISCTNLILVLLLFCSCKKPKPEVFSGQLLLSRKNPVPLSNRKITIYQQGGNAILTGASGAYATAVTDANGRFSITFIPGISYFSIFRGVNSSPLTLMTTDGYPSFVRKNFPDSAYDASKPIFIGKLIDTLIIKISCVKAITPSDTLALKVNVVYPYLNKSYPGITANVGTTFTLDTIYNALFTNYDCFRKTYDNIAIEVGMLKVFPGSTTPSFIGPSIFWMELSADDETKKEMILPSN